MSPSYVLISRLLRWLAPIYYKLRLQVGLFRPRADLIRLILGLCKRFWSRLNSSNPTSTSSHHDPRPTNATHPTPPSKPVYLPRLPFLQVQDATPTTDSSRVGSPLALGSGCARASSTARVPDSTSETTDNDPRCTTATQSPHLGVALATNVHGDNPSVITLDHDSRCTADVGAMGGNLDGGKRTLHVSFARPLSPAISHTSANDGGDPCSRQRSPLGRVAGPRRITLITAMMVQDMMHRRYGRKGQANPKMSNKKMIEAGCRDYSDECPAGWVRHVQAEGAQYFYHTEKRVLTDADMHSKKLQSAALTAAECLRNGANEKSIDISGDIELVLELKVNEKKEWMYYFVDHTAQVVFWIHPMPYKDVVGHVRGVQRKSHIKYAIETQYWMHREMFPLNRSIPLSVLKSLKATLIHAQTEVITSNTSLAPFDVDELGNLVDLVDRMEEGAREGQSDVVFAIARLIRMFTDGKFVNFYGEIGARLNADQSVYSHGEYQPSRILPVLDIFLFGAASAHLQELKGLWVDHTVSFPRWKGFIRKLLAEWNSFTIYSTVMLAVDVSLLGNPGLQVTRTADPRRLQGLISIYLSLVCVVGSLLVSVLLVGQARGQEGESAQGAADFMKRMTHSMLGLEALAMMQSVPYALLVWGMLFFVLAIAFIIFGSSESVIIAIISPAWFVVTLLCMWPLWGSRQRRASLYKLWKRMVGNLPPLFLSKSKETPPLPTTMPTSAEEQ